MLKYLTNHTMSMKNNTNRSSHFVQAKVKNAEVM